LRPKNKERSSRHVNLRVLWGVWASEKVFGLFYLGSHPWGRWWWSQQHKYSKVFFGFFTWDPPPSMGEVVATTNTNTPKSFLVSLIFNFLEFCILLMFGRSHGWPQNNTKLPVLSFSFDGCSVVSVHSRESVYPFFVLIYLIAFCTMFFGSRDGRGPNIGPKM
jgi:hypothetical protein